MPVRTIVITGVAGPVGQRLVWHLGHETLDRIIGIDDRASRPGPGHLDVGRADLATADLAEAFSGADTVVHLAWSPGRPCRGGQPSRVNVDTTRRVLAAAGAAGVDTVVHLSSAAVYGAWPDNAVPLTEEAALRPNVGVLDAVHHAEAERLVADWAEAHRRAAVSVLRPAAMLGPGADSWLARALAGRSGLRSDRTDPARQFVHVDDVATAAAVAVTERLDGVFNVAADGWITSDVLRSLSSARPSLPVPSRLVIPLARWAWRVRLSDVPPDLLPLTEYAWVVANDRLRATGWAPQHSNEDAVVAGRPGSRWREMSPSRRQQAALIVSAAVIASMGVATAAVVARRVGRVAGRGPLPAVSRSQAASAPAVR